MVLGLTLKSLSQPDVEWTLLWPVLGTTARESESSVVLPSHAVCACVSRACCSVDVTVIFCML